ncbi:MAG: Flp pilus assembly complex ATPase component TadA, partial [Actinobacteria bacterium]|nr:Flp pilus assembly complex ATPase component TadA [Actinomycetota bacterium]
MDAPKKRLGDILIAAGLLTPEQMSHALDMQKKTGLRLGEILVGQGLVNDADVAQTVAGQLGMPFVSDSELVVQPEFARLISEPVARRLLALPIGEADGRLTVAMADPLNVFALDEIKSITGRDIGPVVVTEKALHRAIQNAYQLTGLADNPALPKVSSEVEVFRLRDLADEAPVVRLVNSIIQRAIEERASDIHLEPLEDRVRVRYRIDGVLQETMSPPKNVHSPVVSRIKIMASMDISERRIPQDGRIQIKDQGRDVDLRVSTLPTIHGEKVVIRVLDKTRGIIKLEQLGFLPQTLARFQSVINLPYGMVLVTGPTGSGKTTT